MTLTTWRGILLSLALGLGAGATLAHSAEVQLTGSAVAERAFTRAAARPAWVDVLPVTRATAAHGPYSFALIDVQIHLDAQRAVYTRRAIEVHAAAALESVGRIDIDFLPAFQTLDLHGVWVIRDGRRIDRLQQAQVRFLQRETGLDQGLYTGAVTANVVVADLRVNDVLDIEYTIRGANPVMGGKFFYSAGWDSNVPVGRRRVLLDTPDGRAIHTRLVGQDKRPAPLARTERRNGRTRLSFETDGQAAYLGESHVPPEVHPYRWLQFSEMSGWDEVNRWAVELFQPGASGPALERLLPQLRAAGTPEQQAVKALEFVQSEVRYLSVAIGENSHRPAPPETVLERRYGDCKDKSLLLATLLNRLGIEAHVALVGTDMPVGLDQLLPGPHLFDHAIVHLRVNGAEYLLDPTRKGQHGSLARMGQPYRAHQVLIARPGGRQLSVTGAAPDTVPLSRRIERFELEQPGSAAELTVTREFAGAMAETMRSYLAAASPEEHVKQFAAAIAERYPDAVPVGAMAVQDDHAANLVRLVSRFRIGTLFTRTGQRWRMNFSAVNLRDMFNKSDSPQRRYPLMASALHPGDLMEYEMLVQFRDPAGLSAETSTVSIRDAAFEFKVRDDLDPNKIHMRMSLRAGASRVEPGKLAAYANNLGKLNEQLGGSYTVAAAGAAAPASVAAPTPADVLRTRLAQLTAAVDNAGFRGADPAPTLCERARVRQALGQAEAALADAGQAVRLQPKSGAMLLCRAEMHFAGSRFKEAETDYGRAAALGADSPELYSGRAVNAVYLGQAVLAASQFRQALAVADNHADRLRAQIWLALLGTAPAGAAMASASAGDERWLALVLDAIANRVALDDAMHGATGDAGLGADARLGESYFYLGKLLRARGERWKALAYFNQALAKLAPDHPYQPAARHELAQMQEKKP